jgi:DNA-binding NarL/FixJ family response regulator
MATAGVEVATAMSPRRRLRVLETFAESDRAGDGYGRDGQEAHQPVVQFTSRELEVIHLIGAALDTPAIAEQLGIDESAVEWHMRQVIEKLEARSNLRPLVGRKGLVEL